MTTKVKIDSKGYAVPIEMRPIWRISMIVLVVALLEKNTSSIDLRKLNVLIWMLIRKNRWEEYRNYLLGRSNDLPFISVDTSTYKALEFAMVKEFVVIENSKIVMLDKGIKLFNLLIENDILSDELTFVSEIGKKLTQKKLDELSGRLI